MPLTSLKNSIITGDIFLETVMQVFDSTLFSGEYTSKGAMVFTKALDKICGQKNANKSQFDLIDYGRENCLGTKIIDQRLFYPLDLINAGLIQSYNYWYELFKNSVAINFTKGFKYYGSLKEDVTDSANANYKKVLRPKDYGKNKPAVTYIGSTNCPLSFFSISPF